MANANPPQAADLLTLSTLILCMASYLPDISIIPAGVQNATPLTPGGKWQCVWGPAQDSDEANLAFVAGYFPSPGIGPQTICVTVRGTDFDITDIWGILEQVWQDLDAADPQPMPWAPSGPERIAGGTLDGLSIIQGLTDTSGQTIGQYLTAFFSQPANANVTTLVTGHSLGGCLATVVAPWISSLPGCTGTIQPITYAAPTAGNGAFATYYDTKFPTARRFQNSLDVVPLAYYKLGRIDSIYADDGLDTPPLIRDFVRHKKAALKDASYVQPSGKHKLRGVFLAKDGEKGDWHKQALHQHHIKTYFALINGIEVDTATLPEPSTGGVDDALRRLKGD